MLKHSGIATSFIGLGAFLASCSSSPPFCGEAFCLTEKPSFVSKETPVEDFNVYRVRYRDRGFTIYEGNHPNTTRYRELGSVAPDSVPEGFVEGHAYEGGSRYKFVFRTMNRRWPTHVAVSAPSTDLKELDGFVTLFRGQRSSTG